jgi:hypothetical protein
MRPRKLYSNVVEHDNGYAPNRECAIGLLVSDVLKAAGQKSTGFNRESCRLAVSMFKSRNPV